MPNLINIVRRGAPALAMALAGFAACGAPVVARAAVALYEVTVPIAGAAAEDRAAAMADALKAVSVRVSGRRDAATSPAIIAAKPDKYVQRYSTTADKMLKVGFDGQAVEQLLQQAGLPIWPAERPLVVIDAPVTDRAAVEGVAQGRGLAIEWSSGLAPQPAPGRAVLSGVPGGGEFAWTLAYDGRTAVLRGSAEDAMHFAADTLAARYAPPSTRATGSLTLRVDGMDDLADYSGLLAYLRELSLVRSVEVESLDGTLITLRVTLRGDRELLGRIAALDGRLQPPSPGTDPAAPSADFVYVP